MNLEAVSAAERDGFLNPLVGRVQSMLSEARARDEHVGLLLVHAAAVDRIDALQGLNAGDRLSNKIVGVLRSRALRKNDSIEILSSVHFAGACHRLLIPRVQGPGDCRRSLRVLRE